MKDPFCYREAEFLSYGVQTEISLVGSPVEALCDSEIAVLNLTLYNSNGEFWELAPLTPFNMARKGTTQVSSRESPELGRLYSAWVTSGALKWLGVPCDSQFCHQLPV